MKRFLIILLCFLTVFAFASCKEEASADMDVVAEAEAIIEEYSLSGGKFYTSSGELDLDEGLIRSYFGDATDMPNFDTVEEYAVYIDETKPLSPCEFGIFKMNESADKELFVQYLKARIDGKIKTAASYPSMDTEALTTAKITIKGNYVWYCAVKGGNSDINSNLEGKL